MLTEKENLLGLGTEIVTINMGPQHPSTHGVLRIILKLDGERVVDAEPVVGYLHRGIEKICENITFHQCIPYTDRMDYLSPISNNIGICMAFEKLLGIKVTPRAEAVRLICCELARISSHLLWLGTNALDVGAATVFFYTFTEREKIYNIFELLTGARFTVSYCRIGGIRRNLTLEIIDLIRIFLKELQKSVNEIHKLLTKNRIWIERNQDVGRITADDAIERCLTGPNLRASGVEWDIRKAYPYLGYDRFDFEIPVGEHGDCYDRYLVRMQEIEESRKILHQALDALPEGPIFPEDPETLKMFYPPKDLVLHSMEELIHQFIVATEAPYAPKGEIYFSMEAPKGELGFYVVGNGTNKAHRCHFRSPSLINLQGLPMMIKGHMIADVVATVASLDPVLGEVDR